MSSAEDSPQQEATRRLGLLDAMIFVAATAAALALIRAVWREDMAGYISQLFDVSGRSRKEVLSAVVETGLIFVPIHLVAWTLAYLIVALRKPRPPLRELARRPGFAGCFSAVLSTCLGLFNVIVVVLLQSIIPAPIDWQAFGGILNYLIEVMYLGYGIPGIPGFAVASTWAVFALAGYWNPEASAIDRLGRVLSLGWIGLTLAYPAAVYLMWW